MQQTCRLQLSVFETTLGWMGLLVRGETLCGVSFGNRSADAVRRRLIRSSDAKEGASVFSRSLARRLKDFAEGAPEDFLDLDVSHDGLTEFGIAVVERCRRIPYGETLSYGALASAVGKQRAARAVGNVMRSNRCPLVVPCHRVVHGDGRIGQFSAPQGSSMKQRLLAMESATWLSGRKTMPAPRRSRAIFPTIA